MSEQEKLTQEEELFRRFSQEFAEVCQTTDRITISLTWSALWVVFSSLQLALRVLIISHPKNTGPTAERVREITQQFQMILALDPDSALSEVAEKGWNPDYDQE